MKRIIVLTIICSAALLGCGKKDKEPNREPVSTTSLTESSVVSENTSYIEEEIDGIKIDENTFPDEIFRDYIKSKIDKDKNEYLSDEEIGRITEISINGSKDEKYHDLKSLKGVELFVNLEGLSIQWCDLEKLDISKNTKLKVIIIGNTNLSELDVSNNSFLVDLEIVTSNIQELDVSNNKSLRWLDVSATQLYELDLSNNPLLQHLGIRKTNIESLDLSNNSKLERFSCYKASSFKDVDFSNNPMLLSVICNGSAISKLDLTNNPKCFEVECNKDTEIIGGDNIKYLTRY